MCNSSSDRSLLRPHFTSFTFIFGYDVCEFLLRESNVERFLSLHTHLSSHLLESEDHVSPLVFRGLRLKLVLKTNKSVRDVRYRESSRYVR